MGGAERGAAQHGRDAAERDRDAAVAQLAAREAEAAEQREAVEAGRQQALAEARQEAAAQLACARAEPDALLRLTLPEAGALALQLAEAAARAAARHARLAEEAEDERQKRAECAVCFSSARSVAFAPCGHIACCTLCSNQVGHCPVCKQGIRQRIPVYLP